VGISLYFQLLEEKVESIRLGKAKRENTKVELDLSYVLPDDFFDSDIDKLSFFREIEAIESIEDLERIEETFSNNTDHALHNLFLMMKTSLILSGYSVAKLSKIGQNYHFDFYEGTTPAILRAFLERFDKKHDMVIQSVTKVRVETKNWKNAEEFLQNILE
jgi:transcription-repair coupling factor (superfamily II helicase)